VSETGILGASGIFDPSLDFGVNGSYNKSASASQLDGAAVREDRSTRYNLGLSSFLPTGGQASLQFVTSRFETNNQFVNPEPELVIFIRRQFQPTASEEFRHPGEPVGHCHRPHQP
jgi:hypothetical protein